MHRYSSNHNGIAIGPILFVIAILAVLVGAISSGSGGFGSNTSPERAKILAAQIINQAQQVKNAVDRVRANGCADNEISFENGVVSGYTNPNATLAEKPWCHVFQPSGGGIIYTPIPEDAFQLDCHSARPALTQNLYPGGANRVPDIGSDLSELTIQVLCLKESVCGAINTILLNSPSIFVEQRIDSTSFAGTFYDGVSPRGQSKIRAACGLNAANPTYPTGIGYNFYFVLVAR